LFGESVHRSIKAVAAVVVGNDVVVVVEMMQPGEMESSGKEQRMQIVCVRSASTGAASEEAGEWDSSRSALSLFKEKEEEIERKKLEVREKVFSMLGRVEEESKRLTFVRQELEAMPDPTRREVDAIRKRIDKVNKQLKPLGKTCLRKVHYCVYVCLYVSLDFSRIK
jgi:hypothetical protein